MITPRFSCSETDSSVVVNVYCPSVRATDVEINVDDTLFSLHINPYFLRLNFPHGVIEDDNSSAKYDPASGYLTVILTKQVPGQQFEGLDLLAKLLAPRPAPRDQPLIEVVCNDAASSAVEDMTSKTSSLSLHYDELTAAFKAAENDWQLPQSISEQTSLTITANRPYGFLNMHSGYFHHIAQIENEVNELGVDCENCPPDLRRQRRIGRENEKWDPEYYMADFADDDYIQEMIRWEHPHAQSSGDVEFNEKEKLAMLRLPRKEYLPSRNDAYGLYLTLVTLLFSYSYETRSSQMDATAESAWTMSILTPAFAALDPPSYACLPELGHFFVEHVHATLVSSYRRSLAYPLYRSFAFAEACQCDVVAFISKGIRVVLRCLLEMKVILDHHDVYYVYSKIWLDDFCVWIQAYASDEVLARLGDVVKTVKIAKADIGWNLEALEQIVLSGPTGRNADSDDDDDPDETDDTNTDTDDTSSQSSSNGKDA
ncbi:SHQ1-domain-containing protein [Fistulina hepatica ATCC 64428]|nr:SHQ1-domain-containing protein [Fistulina hepatica ATCC 64428]